MAKLAFLGLGVMGYPMAGHLLKKGGHDVTVYNRTAAKAQQWVKEYGGKAAATPREAARDCDFVMMCVGNDDDDEVAVPGGLRSEEHTSELQSPCNLVCRLLLEKKKNNNDIDFFSDNQHILNIKLVTFNPVLRFHFAAS